jgi:predicted secreted protein
MKTAPRFLSLVAVFSLVTALSCAAVCAQAPAKPPLASSSRVTEAAVWNPPPEAVAAIRAKCDPDPPHLESCFLAEMKSAGSSAEAVAFSRSLAGTGVIYLRGYRKVARVDVAYIQYVFRANELEGVLLVNGDPSPIDVDDDSQYPQTELQKYPGYAALADKYPNISLWPGDRNSPLLPKLDSTGWGTQTFLVDYILRDGCHACAQIGTATFAFAFDSQGRFQGTHVSSVKPTASRESQSSSVSEFQTAGVEQVRVLAGKEFSITLPANHTTGYSWRLASTPDPALLQQVSNVYNERKSEDPNAVGAPGDEVWTFSAGAQGSVPLVFEYARPFEKDAKPVKTSKFLVVIE